MGFFRRRAHDERGTVLVVVSIAMTVMFGATALAVDIGRKTVNNRDLQAAADVIALDAVRALGGGLAAVADAAEESAVRNDFAPEQVTVKLGTKIGSAPFVETAVAPNAVQVTTHGTVDFAFTPGSGSSSRSAVAVQSKSAGFSIGSFVASIPAGGKGVLHAILGDEFGLSLVSYDKLVGATVTLGDIATQVGVSPSALLENEILLSDFYLAAANVVGQDATAAAELLGLAASVPGQMINLADAVAIATGGEDVAATAQLDVLRILTTSALVATGEHTIQIPKTELNLPGIGDVTVKLTVTNPAKTVFGPIGTSAETNQVSLEVTPSIELGQSSGTVNGCTLGSFLAGLLSLNLGSVVCLLGGFLPKLVTLDLKASLPVTVTAAGAKATLTDVDCATPARMQLTPELHPVTLTGGATVNLAATLLGVPIGDVARINGSINTQVTGAAGPQWYDETKFGQAQSVGAGTLGLGATHPMTFSSFQVAQLNLAPVVNGLSGTLGGLLNSALATVSTAVIEPLSHLLGLNLFGADLTPLAVSCGGVRLVE